MGNNVIPRQQGDAYQACFFWLQAGQLFQPHTYVEKVVWESNSTAGFDDVIVHYRNGKLDDGEPIRQENFSVKFHVDHSRAFTCDALIDPSFIGTRKATILSRLHDAFKEEPAIFNRSRYSIVNTWGIDRNDPLASFLGNGGAIRLQVLFDGTGDNSKYGKVRKAWREHLGITSDEELKQILQPLRIIHNYADLNGIIDRLNDKLQLAKLKPLDAGKRTTGYVELIQRLHSQGKKEFTRDELQQICEKEGLVVIDPKKTDDRHIMGVRSFRKGAEDLESEVNEVLCLLNQFTGRYIQSEASWPQVFAKVSGFADRGIAIKKPIELHLDTHLSLAYSLGYCMDFKHGVQASVIQKTISGKKAWAPDLDQIASYTQDLWNFGFQEVNPDGTDLAVAVCATHDIDANVRAYINSRLPTAAGALSCRILPHPSNTVFQDANHIVAAVQKLVQQIRVEKMKIPSLEKVHLFIAAPNAFAFFLGQQSRPIGQVTLYEFDIDGLNGGGYQSSISLPM